MNAATYLPAIKFLNQIQGNSINFRDFSVNIVVSVTRSLWSRGLRRRSAAARLLRPWVRIPPGAWMFVCYECRVLSGRGLCDELITRPEESYRLWCVVVCDLEEPQEWGHDPRWVAAPQRKKKSLFLLGATVVFCSSRAPNNLGTPLYVTQPQQLIHSFI